MTDHGAALSAAESEYLAELIERGILPVGARREPTARELRAGVRFAELDRIVGDAVGLITRTLTPIRDRVLAELATVVAAQLEPGASPYDVATVLAALTVADVEGLADLIEDVVDDVAGQLVEVAQAAADEALSEAARQGIPGRLIGAVDVDTDEVRAAAHAGARRAATAHVTRAIGAATEEAARAATLPGASVASTVEAASTAAGAASVAGVEDLARQAANVAHGIGRRDAQTSLPEPSEVYASELLDRNTCGPCATVDGTEYATLEEGMADYPGAGGYYACDGGSRCRGTLVIVWAREADATLERPGRRQGGR